MELQKLLEFMDMALCMEECNYVLLSGYAHCERTTQPLDWTQRAGACQGPFRSGSGSDAFKTMSITVSQVSKLSDDSKKMAIPVTYTNKSVPKKSLMQKLSSDAS